MSRSLTENVQSSVALSVPLTLTVTSVNRTSPGWMPMKVDVGNVVVTTGFGVGTGVGLLPPPPQPVRPTASARNNPTGDTPLPPLHVRTRDIDLPLLSPANRSGHPIRSEPQG